LTGWYALRVIEVSESEAAQRKFQESRLDPAFDRAGIPRVTAAFYPAYTMLPPPEAFAAMAAGGDG
jgi:hypothetical protein